MNKLKKKKNQLTVTKAGKPQKKKQMLQCKINNNKMLAKLK